MHNSGTNSYKKSEMREYLVPLEGVSGSGVFLEGLVNAGVPANVLWAPKRYIANKGSGATTADLIEDKLWLISVWEFCGAGPNYRVVGYETAENQVYLKSYYKDVSRRNKYDKNGAVATYWLASPYKSNVTNFCSVTAGTSKGHLITANATTAHGVAPAFCVK
jgi:hypothetical protein